MVDFEEIYTTHFDGVYRYILSLCGNGDIAEEITQEAFYKAMEHLDRFDGTCRLYVWLCQIAKNTYFTYIKKQKRHVPQDELILTEQTTLAMEEELLDQESVWELHKLLHQLSEPYKEVFSLRVFGEMPFSQIGELFGKTDSWARLIFYRAKKELRRGFNENHL